MTELYVCEDCGKKAKYYRVAFGSWRCSKCGKETEEKKPPTRTGEMIAADNWWRALSWNEQIIIYRHYKERPIL